MQGHAASGEHLRHLEVVVQNTANMVVVTNKHREIEWVNPAYTKVTGWSLDEVRGKNPKSFLHGPRTSEQAATRLSSSLRDGLAVTDFEILNYKKSGEPYWVSLNIQPVANEAGEITQYVAIESDITQRKRAEHDAARLLHQLAEAQRIAKLGLVEHDLASGLLRCSPEIYRLFDASPQEFDTSFEGLMKHVHPDDAARVRADYEHAVNGGRAYDAELRLLTLAGRLKWVHARGALEGWDDGRPALFRVVVQDITERKDAEQLRQDKELLQLASKTQMEVLARVSHELRTPLHAVLGFAEALERAEAGRLSERSRSHVGHIQSSARHLLALVNDILDLTRLHGGGTHFHIHPVDLCALVLDVVAMVAPLALPRRVLIEVEPAASAMWALADSKRFKQVLINVLGNAIKYNRAGGRIDVRFVDDPREGRVQIAIADTGIGLSAQQQTHLFEPFYRVAGEGPPGGDSSGLGLAIAKCLAEGMGGAIACESRLGEGSTFRLTLPRCEAGLAVPALAPAPPGAALHPGEPQALGTAHGSVLYMEDNEVNQLLIEAFLAERPEVTLHCQATGASGLAAARSLRPRLIVIDMNLPDMSGQEVMRAVQGDPLLQHTPCIAFSASDDERLIDDALRGGFRAYWHKPLARREFLQAIDHWLATEPRTAAP